MADILISHYQLSFFISLHYFISVRCATRATQSSGATAMIYAMAHVDKHDAREMRAKIRRRVARVARAQRQARWRALPCATASVRLRRRSVMARAFAARYARARCAARSVYYATPRPPPYCRGHAVVTVMRRRAVRRAHGAALRRG